MEFLGKLDKLIDYTQKNPQLGVSYGVVDNGRCKYKGFSFDKSKSFDEELEIEEKLKKDFDISIFMTLDEESEWLKCNSYQEYVTYWEEKCSKNKDTHAPFTIADFFSEKEIYWPHWGGTEKHVHLVNRHSNVLRWYYEYADEAFDHTICKDCELNGWCDKEECCDERNEIKQKNIPEENACLYLLGRICVHSESGYLPDYVVEKLMEISEYSCHHMG